MLITSPLIVLGWRYIKGCIITALDLIFERFSVVPPYSLNRDQSQ